jgi:hypothetical protein
VCAGLPEQTEPRNLAFELFLHEETTPPLLVLDDNAEFSPPLLEKLLGGYQNYTYSQAIRCQVEIDALSLEVEAEVLSRCAVWTNFLLKQRQVIITTERGLRQMKLEKEHRVGDMFRSARLGIVLVIHPLQYLKRNPEEFRITKSKVARVLKEAGLI